MMKKQKIIVIFEKIKNQNKKKDEVYKNENKNNEEEKISENNKSKREDKVNGEGILYDTNLSDVKYKGNFVDGLRKGKGVIYYKNGDRYEGEFDNDDNITRIKREKKSGTQGKNKCGC